MKAVVLKKPCSSKDLMVVEVPPPMIETPTSVLVKMEYAGVNYADILSRKGLYSWAPSRPFILGLEGAGEVVEVGSKVTAVQPGDKVIVATNHGTYAEYITLDETRVTPIIKEYSMAENAAFIASFMTAMIALRDMARVRKNETILVQAAAGALGIAAVQLSKQMGLKVAGTASKPRKIQFLEDQLKIDKAINYLTNDFKEEIMKWTNGQGVDIILESVGGKVFKKSLKSLAPMGRIILVGATSIKYNKFNPFSLWKAWKSIPRINLLTSIRKSNGVLGLHAGWLLTESREKLLPTLNELRTLAEQRKVKPIIDKIYTLDKAGQAHDRIDMRQNIGKVLLKI